MNISNLVPAHALARMYGVKAIIYGPPGSGKTPLVQTLESLNPVTGVTEPGMLAMRKSNLAAYPAFTAAAIREFRDWIIGSHESKQFGVKVIDSVSQMAEIFLKEALDKGYKDPRKAYGEMATECMKVLEGLYFAPETHVILIAKEDAGDESTEKKKRPYFPGKELNVKVPHQFDAVLRLDSYLVNNQRVKALQCVDSFAAFARDRSGSLSEFEPPNLAALVNKIMAATSN